MFQVRPILKRLDPFLKLSIVLGTMVYLTELSHRSAGAQERFPGFVWTEGLIAVVFSVEYLLRWLDDAQDHYGWHYPQSAMGLVDLLSILPFWIGFFVPPGRGHLLRALRTFQLLKFFRYNRSLQLVALGFYRAWPAWKPLLFTQLVCFAPAEFGVLI